MIFPGVKSSPSPRSSIYLRQVSLLLVGGFAGALLLFWPIRHEILRFDEDSYNTAAGDIRQKGILSKYAWAEIHTYVYPSVLAYGLPACFRIPPHSTRLSIFLLQAVLFFAAAFYMAHSLLPAFGAKQCLFIVAALCLNPFNLLYLSYALTDPLSLILTLVLVTSVAMSFRGDGFLTLKDSVSIGLLLGFAGLIRPANVYLLCLAIPALILHLYQGIRSGHARQALSASFIVIFFAGIVCLPQSINNYRNLNQLSPLIVESGVGQLSLGRLNLKYATYVGPAKIGPGISYQNPFFNPTGDDSGSYFHKIRAWILSAAVKVFALVDQDFIRPYLLSLTPPDRWVGTLLSLGIVAIGSAGLLVQAGRAFKALLQTRFLHLRPDHAFALCSLATILGCFALYSQTSVETRFGLPVIALSALFIPAALSDWKRLRKQGRILSVICLFLTIAAGCLLSHWVQTLSEPIVRSWPA
jgi:hypothetical protein